MQWNENSAAREVGCTPRQGQRQRGCWWLHTAAGFEQHRRRRLPDVTDGAAQRERGQVHVQLSSSAYDIVSCNPSLLQASAALSYASTWHPVTCSSNVQAWPTCLPRGCSPAHRRFRRYHHRAYRPPLRCPPVDKLLATRIDLQIKGDQLYHPYAATAMPEITPDDASCCDRRKCDFPPGRWAFSARRRLGRR